MQSISIIENGVKVGHLLNKFNELNQVVERQDFWRYESFGNEEGWYYLNNRIHTITYDTVGFLQTIKTEVYNPKTRIWETEDHKYSCSVIENTEKHVIECQMDLGQRLFFELDQIGNWIYKEERNQEEVKITKREIKYYE